jgi:hypothetical protein
MSEEAERKRVLQLVKKLKVKNEEWNTLGIMLLISKREKAKKRMHNKKAN